MEKDVFGILGKVIAGTYSVEQVVAEGGFGVVYRAYHRGFRARVALKCLKIPATLTVAQRSQFLEQFRAEAEVLFRLSAVTPTIVRPLHIDTFQNAGKVVPFIALEWLDGWTLDAIIAQRVSQGRPPIALRKLVRMFTPVARAIEQAHALPGVRGSVAIIHRDLKPENLFVAFIGGEQVVKILDFGISKVKSGGSWARRELATEGGLISFSPAYGAPEQWAPELFGPTGTWTDVWGLALTMVEAIKGSEIFSGELAAMKAAILDPARRPTPRSEGVRVSDQVEAIFQRALALDPASRFPSVRAFWDELLAVLDLDSTGQPRWSRREDPRVEGTSLPDTFEQLEGASLAARLTGLPPPRTSTLPPAAATAPRSAPAQPSGAQRPLAGSSRPPRWEPSPEVDALEFELPSAPPEWPPVLDAPVLDAPVEVGAALENKPLPVVPALEIPSAPAVPLDLELAPAPRAPLELATDDGLSSQPPARHLSSPPPGHLSSPPRRLSSSPSVPPPGGSTAPERPSPAPAAGPFGSGLSSAPSSPLAQTASVRPEPASSSLRPSAWPRSDAGQLSATGTRDAAFSRRPEIRLSWSALAAALLLLVAAVVLAAFNQNHGALQGGESLYFGPLRATWISLALFVAAVGLGVWSVLRRSED